MMRITARRDQASWLAETDLDAHWTLKESFYRKVTFLRGEPRFHVRPGVSWEGSMARYDKARWVTTTGAHLAKLMARRVPERVLLQKVPEGRILTFFRTFPEKRATVGNPCSPGRESVLDVPKSAVFRTPIFRPKRTPGHNLQKNQKG